MDFIMNMISECDLLHLLLLKVVVNNEERSGNTGSYKIISCQLTNINWFYEINHPKNEYDEDSNLPKKPQ